MSPTPLGTIARHLAPSPPDDRTFRRRRLASLAVVLALVLTVGSFVGGRTDGAVDVTTDLAAGDQVLQAASLGSPSAVRELLSETTTTLVEVTGATTTSTTQAPAAPVTTEPTPTTEVAHAADEADEAEPEPTTTVPEAAARALSVASDEQDDEVEAPTTTAAPRQESPTTTAAPTTTTTTPPQQSESSEGYAYDDPRSTQVWYDLAECESGGNWSIDTGNGYYGGLQFSLASWESVGGSGYPHEHPAGTQIEFGRELQSRQGWGAWPHCSEELGLR